MPRSPYKIRRTASARRDIAEIRAVTLRTWGDDQWQVYRERINQTLRDIATRPELGQSVQNRKNLPLYRKHMGRPKARHYVYYTIEADAVVIYRLIHDSRDQQRQL